MSLWKIGANDVSEEAQSYKDRLASKDAQIAALDDIVAKQVHDIEELKSTLNERLQDLRMQADRVLRLEEDLTTKEDQLQNAKVTNINHQASLASAEKSSHDQTLQIKHLQSIIDTLSNQSESTAAEKTSLAREKSKMEQRIRELEAMVPHPTAPTPSRITRPRSSSLNNLRLASLQDELERARQTINSKDDALEVSRRKLLSAQADLSRCENEKVATERRLQAQVTELRGDLEDKEEELNFYKDGQAAQGREEELLRRIEEDEAKIAAMEALLKDDRETRELKRKLNLADSQLKSALAKLADCEERATILVTEREEAYDKVEQLKATQIAPKCISDEEAKGIQTMQETIERLRAERNELRMHLEYLEPENRFTAQALQQARERIATLETQLSSVALIQEESSTFKIRFAAAQQLISKQRATSHRLEQGANALVLLITHLNTEHQAELEVSRQWAHTLEIRAAQAEERESQAKRAKQDESTLREDAEGRLSDATMALEETERERANFALQVHHLDQDLQTARRELADAEERYNTLQSQQFAALNSTDVKKALKGRIEELEGRILRRNQQIGEHQHDIKRLEMNLKLQEDRVAELTTELQTATTEKANMVLDCADARDARDTALRTVDDLEEQLEDVRTENETLSKELAEAKATMLASNHSLSAGLNNSQIELASLKQTLAETEVLAAKTETRYAEHVQRLETQNNLLAAQLEERKVDGETALAELNHITTNARQLTVALALSQSELKKLSLVLRHRSQTVAEESTRFQSQLSSLSATNDSLLRRIETLQEEASSSEGQLSERLRELTEEVDSVHELLRQEREGREAEVSSLQEAQQKLDSLEDRLAKVDKQLEEERLEHAARLQFVESALAESKKNYEDLESQQAQLEDDHARRQKEVERELSQYKQASIDSRSQLDILESAKAEEAEELKQKLDDLTKNLATARQEYDSLALVHTECDSQQLKLQREYEEQLSTANDESLKQRQSLEAEISTLRTAHEEFDRLLTATTSQLEALQKSHNSESRKYEEELQAKLADADKERYEMEQMMTRMEEELSELHERVSTLNDNSDRLEAEITGRVAEIQRLTSFQQFLQNQAANHEKKVTELAQALREAEDRLAEAEKTHQDVSTNLTLDNLRLQQDMKSLRLELQQFKTQPDTKTIIAELEEKSRDMEELLRQKCGEIENNDDRIMEMVKEKKKLSAKVDNLTRKVQALQTKLASTSSPSATSEPKPIPALNTAAPAAARSVSEHPPLFKSATFSAALPSVPVAGMRPLVNNLPANSEAPLLSRRAVSTSSLNQFPSSCLHHDQPLPSSATFPDPQREYTSPEAQRGSVLSSASPLGESPSTLGKRRRLHDEGEDEDEIPPSAFSPEVVPEAQSTRTPRSKRVFSAVHSGFTPVRRHATAIVRSISPTRPKPTPSTISDVTNSRPPVPQERGTKRTWLGKLRTGNGPAGEGGSS